MARRSEATLSVWIWPQVASCDLRLHLALHFRCNEKLRHLSHSEQKQQLHLRSNERPRKLGHAEPRQRRTEATEHRPHEARKQWPGVRRKQEEKKLGAHNLDQQRTQNALRAASEVLRRSLALLKCLWKRLGPLLRGLREAPGTSRGALGSVLGSSETVSETILDGFWSSEEPD